MDGWLDESMHTWKAPAAVHMGVCAWSDYLSPHVCCDPCWSPQVIRHCLSTEWSLDLCASDPIAHCKCLQALQVPASSFTVFQEHIGPRYALKARQQVTRCALSAVLHVVHVCAKRLLGA